MAKKKLEKEEFKFSKKQLISSKKYMNDRDILLAILDDSEVYSFDEVDEKIDKFMEVKEMI